MPLYPGVKNFVTATKLLHTTVYIGLQPVITNAVLLLGLPDAFGLNVDWFEYLT